MAFDKESEIYRALERACCTYQEEVSDPIANRYLGERGLREGTIRKFRLGYSPGSFDFIMRKLGGEFSLDHLKRAGLVGEGRTECPVTGNEGPVDFDRMHGRIVFPFLNLDGRVIGFSGRTFPTVDRRGRVCQDPAKYINSSFTDVFSQSDFFYGLNLACGTARKAGVLYVFEGQFDVLLAHQNGLENAVGLVGTHLNRERAGFLMQKFPGAKIRACYDGDESGMKAAFKSLEETESLDKVIISCVIPGYDPADIFKIGGTLEANLRRVW